MSEINKIKSVSVDAIENAIAKALSELIGDAYDCSISNIEYKVIEGAKFDVTINKHF